MSSLLKTPQELLCYEADGMLPNVTYPGGCCIRCRSCLSSNYLFILPHKSDAMDCCHTMLYMYTQLLPESPC